MQVPLQIKFRHMEPSAIIEARIRERCHKLQRFAGYVTRCRVTIDAQHGHQHKAGLYRVIVDITLPDEEIVTSHHPDQNHTHENVNVAMQDAFDAARRQLEDYVRQRRAYMKIQDSKLHRKIA
ncbi:MAG: ribosome-associated translation inhibitor RaiA [Halobacteria archaeon]|nr:ribosome-associated translation inhibitor RaiA [Halobacteria archaeon]